jgi:hypothetical protein
MPNLGPPLDLLLEFSHHHCVAICALLVPANLLATVQTLVWVATTASSKRPPARGLVGSIALATGLATILSLHVLSWLWVGVVMAPTYILLSLALVCLSLNGWALIQSPSLQVLLLKITQKAMSLQVVQKGVSWARWAFPS